MKIFNSALYVGILGVAAHFVGESFDRERFNENAYPFACRRWEQGGKIYRKLGVRVWKDRVPDMSRVLPDMFPKRISDSGDVETVRRLIKETCVAEFVHNCLSILFLMGVWLINDCALEGFLLGLFAVACNLPYVVIQRYNRPMLMRYLARLEKKRRVSGFGEIEEAAERTEI